MRTGVEYREALRDGRRVWVMGEGWAGDVTVHPATRATVEEYAAWYDCHLDPAWQEVLLAPADADGERMPWAYVVPKGVADLIGMGRSFAKTMFLSAGNITPHAGLRQSDRARRTDRGAVAATCRNRTPPRLWLTAS
jgi:4-hydroxyphenylacetate 3-monooxygenase